MHDDNSFYAIVGIAFLGAVALIMMAIPVETTQITVIDKRWQTTMALQERYDVQEYVCHTRTRTNYDGETETYQDCGYETVTKTRTLESATLSGGPYDKVVYPPEYPINGRQFNSKGGSFVITMRMSDEQIKTRHVSEIEFVSRYIPGLECEAKLNIYGGVIRDNCVAIGR